MVRIATNYPASSDSFGVPASPTTTPLSSAGSSTRNHVTHHRDLGDAVVAIQNNVTQLTHSHNGTGLQGAKLLQANTHEAPDTNASTSSLHHTLGTGATQAAAGDHNHDTRYIRLDGAVTQSITGRKDFPSGAASIGIPDFTNAQHSHTNIYNGGPIHSTTGIYTQNWGNVSGSTTVDVYLHPNRFTIPAYAELTGFIHVVYYIDYANGAAGAQPAGNTNHNAFFYTSWNNGQSPAFSNTRNVILNGGTFNGTMMQMSHRWNEGGFIQDARMQGMMPIYMPASSVDRPNMCLVMRMNNVSVGWLKEVSWGLNLNLASSSYMNL